MLSHDLAAQPRSTEVIPQGLSHAAGQLIGVQNVGVTAILPLDVIYD
jgi:hypothetical protein